MISLKLQQAEQLHATGKSREALTLLDACRKDGETSAALWRLMAEIFSALGMESAQEQVLREGLARDAQDLSLLQALAHFYYRANRAEDGLALLAPIIDKKDVPADMLLTYATLCKAAGKTEEARKRFEIILARAPKNAAALSNLAGIYLDERNYKKALPLYQQALAIEPANSHIAAQLARVYFRMGELEKGWQHYASRFGLQPHDPHATAMRRPFSQPLWQGEKLRDGQTLLLWAEQGIGEEIMYASMLPDALQRCVNIVVECEARLVPLFARSFPTISFVARQDPPHEKLHASNITHQAPLGHLGGLFRKSFSDFPKAPSYLKANAQKTAACRARYEARKPGANGLIIGVSWRSKPLRQGDPKSTPLSLWKPLLENSPHLFVSLQYGEDAPEKIYQDPAINQQLSLDDFAVQTAAMDKVITVSNSTAHMAGALGVKTAVLLPASRGLMAHWFDGRDNSPWYPSLTLLRQQQDGVWDDVFAKAQTFLNA